ncbi:hypothetical protein GETHLI_11960 [Geothrix limicola]|uniref:MarR family transcriptional regulator n=1 Tax=Geothrix limicola TaxID=2927978 RepID=A0ABQ5QDN7_9BACT|nr:hypothetical protein [Geothrix limicola]GLH72694.1 hypothetical protein GETHLI_11960 [Geothrix limicola]
MTEPITSRQLHLLQAVAKHPGMTLDHLKRAGATDVDMAYLVKHDLIRERDPEQYHVTHMGRAVLKRSL